MVVPGVRTLEQPTTPPASGALRASESARAETVRWVGLNMGGNSFAEVLSNAGPAPATGRKRETDYEGRNHRGTPRKHRRALIRHHLHGNSQSRGARHPCEVAKSNRRSVLAY